MEPMDDETFARLFTAQYAALADDLPLWVALAHEFGGPILEIGCGAGRVLRVLAEAGFEVTGIDTNPAMLRLAQAAIAGAEGKRIHLIEQDVRRLGLDARFGLILAPCNTLSALADAELAQTLGRVRAHLRPKGLLALEVPGPGEPATDEDDEPVAAFIDPETGWPVQVSAAQQADPAGEQVQVTWRYDELHPDGTVQSWRLPVTYYLRRPEAYARLLAQAGFGAPAFLGGYDRRLLAAGDTRMIVMALG
jgi:SAM-dependent methyltransferase